MNRDRTKNNPGWAAFDLKHKRKQEGLSLEIDIEPYPTLSGAFSSESLLKKDQLLLERPFSSVLMNSVNFPSIGTSSKNLGKQVPVTENYLVTSQSNKVAVGEDETGRNIVELCKKLNKLHPWADESLIKDVMTGVSNDVDEASVILEAMFSSENKDMKNKLVESNHENNNASLASEAVSFGGTTDHPGPTWFNEMCFNETCKAMMDNHTSFKKMLPCDGRNSNFKLDATKFSLLEPEWEEDDVYLIHRKDAVRMMRYEFNMFFLLPFFFLGIFCLYMIELLSTNTDFVHLINPRVHVLHFILRNLSKRDQDGERKCAKRPSFRALLQEASKIYNQKMPFHGKGRKFSLSTIANTTLKVGRAVIYLHQRLIHILSLIIKL